MPINGLIGKKIGTTEIFRENGDAMCVTAVLAGPCTVTQVKKLGNDGYASVQLGFEEVNNVNQPTNGHLASAGKLFRHLKELRTDEDSEISVGQELDVTLFGLGEKIDATGWTKGRGFAGGVKRHGFRGGPKTHGQSDRHRAPGSIGAGSTPGRVIKGLKMAGHMGTNRITVRNLEIMSIDPAKNLLMIKGALPGATNSLLLIRKADNQTG